MKTLAEEGVQDRLSLGIGLTLITWAVFIGVDTSAKWLIQDGMPVPEVVFIRYLFHGLLVAAIFLPQMGRDLVKMNRPRLTLLRGAALGAGTTLNFIALSYLPLTVTTSIYFSTPLVVAALSIPVLGEKVGPRRWAAIGVGFCGVLIVTRPWGASFHPAMILCLGVILVTATYILLTRMLAGVERTATMQLWAALIPACAFAPFAFSVWVWPETPASWVAFFAIGAFGFVGHQIWTVAHRYAPASVLTPLMYSQILFASAASWLIFHQPPTLWTVAGGVVIIASGLYVWLREQILKERNR